MNQHRRPMMNLVHVREYGPAEPVVENGKPVYRKDGSQVTRRKAQFHQIGVAFPNDHDEGYDCIFYAFPVGASPEANGGVRIKMMLPRPKEGEQRGRREPERQYKRPQQQQGFAPPEEESPFPGDDNLPF